LDLGNRLLRFDPKFTAFSQCINGGNPAESGKGANRLAEYGNVVVILSIMGNEEETDTWRGSELVRS